MENGRVEADRGQNICEVLFASPLFALKNKPHMIIQSSGDCPRSVKAAPRTEPDRGKSALFR